MRHPRRRLPHEYPKRNWLFVTWHLHGSLPPFLHPPPGKPTDGKAFAWMDRFLDTTRAGVETSLDAAGKSARQECLRHVGHSDCRQL